MAIAIYMIIFAITLAIYWLLGLPISTLYFHPEADMDALEQSLEVDVLIGVIIGLSGVLISKILSKRTRWSQNLDQYFADIFRDYRPLELTVIAVMSALVEEVVFRGALQDQLGIFWASVLFGCMHIPQERSHWPWTLSALIMGFIFGALYDWRGSITAPIIAHFTINFFNLHALANLAPSPVDGSEL